MNSPVGRSRESVSVAIEAKTREDVTRRGREMGV